MLNFFTHVTVTSSNISFFFVLKKYIITHYLVALRWICRFGNAAALLSSSEINSLIIIVDDWMKFLNSIRTAKYCNITKSVHPKLQKANLWNEHKTKWIALVVTSNIRAQIRNQRKYTWQSVLSCYIKMVTFS